MIWINKLVAEFGKDHWCVYADIDELLIFPGYENHPINAVISYAERRGDDAVAGIMLDMCSATLGESRGYVPGSDPLQQFPYFDPRYTFLGGTDCPYINVTGGWRDALLGERSAKVKTPIINGRSGIRFLASSHHITPARISDLSVVLLHFKMLDDLNEYARQQLANKTRLPFVLFRYFVYEKLLAGLGPDEKLISAAAQRYQSSRQLAELGLINCPPDAGLLV